jgi:hypothetical protein
MRADVSITQRDRQAERHLFAIVLLLIAFFGRLLLAYRNECKQRQSKFSFLNIFLEIFK